MASGQPGLTELPEELWRQIFKATSLPKFPLLDLLALRTVCHCWNKIICSFTRVNTKSLKDFSKLPEIFDLRSLSLSQAVVLPNFDLLTTLHTLKISGPTVFDLAQLGVLTNLTKLRISTPWVTSLGPLTFLQCLYLKIPYAIDRPNVLPQLPNLKLLISDSLALQGWKYTGHGIERSVKDAEGKYTYYDGIWKDGVRINGVETYEDDSRYEGPFEGDVPHGFGIDYYRSGSRYEGMFRAGRRHGAGTFYYFDGGKFIGTYTNDLKTGPGVLHYCDGGRYEGPFENDLANGLGIQYWETGVRTEALFKDGKKNGPGTEYTNIGRVETSYKDDLREGPGVIYFDDGDRWEGTYAGDLRSGPAILYFGDGSRFEGMYGGTTGKQAGGRNGPGISYFTDGEKYECEYVNSEAINPGTLYRVTGEKIEMNFEELPADKMKIVNPNAKKLRDEKEVETKDVSTQ